MDGLLLWLGRAAGLGGVLLCVFAAVLRLSGTYWLAGFQVGTLLQVGAVAMLFACLCFLAYLVQTAKTAR